VEHPQTNRQAKAANKIIFNKLKKRLDPAKGSWSLSIKGEHVDDPTSIRGWEDLDERPLFFGLVGCTVLTGGTKSTIG